MYFVGGSSASQALTSALTPQSTFACWPAARAGTAGTTPDTRNQLQFPCFSWSFTKGKVGSRARNPGEKLRLLVLYRMVSGSSQLDSWERRKVDIKDAHPKTNTHERPFGFRRNVSADGRFQNRFKTFPKFGFGPVQKKPDPQTNCVFINFD